MTPTETTTELKQAFPFGAEAEKPVVLIDNLAQSHHIALPPGWTHKHVDEETLLQTPRRKKAADAFDDAQSFIEYVNRHKTDHTAIYCAADFPGGKLKFLAILDDHGQALPHWRGHKATYTPPTSVEWGRWASSDGKPQLQGDFAVFVEDNIADVAGGDGFPSGSDMLKMATDLELNSDKRYKSKVNLQGGGVRLTLVDDDDEQTRKDMEVFARFRLGIRVFRGAAGYPLEVRLRHHVDGARVKFTYLLIRPDLVFETAGKALIEQIKAGTEVPVYMGTPST